MSKILDKMPEHLQKQIKATILRKKYRALRRAIKDQRLILRQNIADMHRLKDELRLLGVKG